MSEKLLPCPFCGGEARTFEYDGANQATCGGKHIDCAGTDVVAPVAMWNRRTPAPEGEASWIEPALVEHLRSLGCVCPKPLVGYRPNAGPRCRLCNVEPASPVVPAPEGEAWRTVPVEPTEAMLVNGREALMPLVRLDSYGPLIGVWGDMLAASPVVPVGSADTLERQAAEIARLREAITVAAVELQLAGGWLREAGAYGPRVTATLDASNNARAALTGEDAATLGLSGKTQTDARTRGDG